MFSSISSRWKTLKTKYVKHLFTFVCIFTFMHYSSLSGFAYSSYDNFPFSSSYLSCNFYTQDSVIDGDGELIANNIYNFDNTSLSVSRIIYALSRADYVYDIPVNIDAFDYYIISSLYGSADDISQFTFFPSLVQCYYRDHNGTSIPYTLTDVHYYHLDTDKHKGFSVSCKIDFSVSSVIEYFAFNSSSLGTVPSNLKYQFSVIALPKGMRSGDITQSVVNAINNQTDVILNGNSSTSGIVSSADSSKSELESIVSDYQQIENSMLDNFTLYQDEILVDLRGWSWGGLRSCAKWVGDTLTDYYNNLGDFKQYIIYPLLLGIALFFIGRGSAIIGHLYRKPTVTTTYTESTSTRYRSGNHSGTNTSTTTYREGGVLRK